MVSASTLLQAQTRGPGTISGRVLDTQSKAPVEYANIVLLDTTKLVMVSGIVSDSNGFFRLEKIPFGTYFLEYSFIGYEKKRSKAIVIARNKTRVEVGELRLVPSSTSMNEVTVTAERNMMINKIDRKVFNVEKDISAQTGTVSDVLQSIPSVAVDMDGNISLRGSGVTILINGRPSPLGSAANLDQMPASLIEKVEVITNPSAKYKPDGTGGIINIILKKEQKAGFNGILGANAGNNNRYNTNLQLNYNTGPVNIYGSYGFRKDYRLRTSEFSAQTIDTASGQSTWLWQNSKGTAKPMSHLGRLGMDWNISKKDATGISGTYNYREVERTDVANNQYKNNEQQPTEIFTRSMSGKETENSLGMTGFYEHTFNKEKEHTLKFNFEFQSDKEKEDDSYHTVYSLPAYPDAKDHTIGTNQQQETNLQADYNRPLWKDASLEAGYEGNIQITDQNTEVQHYNPESNIWTVSPEESNRFYANQTVHALFTTVSSTWKKFSVMGGLRAEQTLLSLEFRSLDTTAENNYFALYPTLHLSLASGENEWQLNYSRRINRPDGEDMNPVPEYRDPRNIFVGNPNLKPEDIHSVEFGYSVRFENVNLIPTLFYRYKVHGFTMVTHSINDTLLETTFDNLATDQSAGLDFSGTATVAKIINLNFSASGFYSQIDASNIGYSKNKSTFAWNTKLIAAINITKSTMFQVNTQYRSEALTAQGFRRATWVMNLGLRQDFWKKKLSFLVTVSDLFNTQAWKNSINTPTLVQESTRRRDARVIYGGVVWNFGSNPKKAKDVKFEFDNGMEK